jgi:chaperonin GroEL (HSP60 family)
MAVESFAKAIEIIPKTLAENAGLDPIDLMIALRSAHKSGEIHAGINVLEKKVDDLLTQHVLEPLRLSLQELQAATEAAIMILRIDDVIAAKGKAGSASLGSEMEDIQDY